MFINIKIFGLLIYFQTTSTFKLIQSYLARIWRNTELNMKFSFNMIGYIWSFKKNTFSTDSIFYKTTYFWEMDTFMWMIKWIVW